MFRNSCSLFFKDYCSFCRIRITSTCTPFIYLFYTIHQHLLALSDLTMSMYRCVNNLCYMSVTCRCRHCLYIYTYQIYAIKYANSLDAESKYIWIDMFSAWMDLKGLKVDVITTPGTSEVSCRTVFRNYLELHGLQYILRSSFQQHMNPYLLMYSYYIRVKCNFLFHMIHILYSFTVLTE